MLTIDWHPGPRADLRPLFELAEDSAVQLDAYLSLGRVLVARDGGEVIGHLQLIDAAEPDEAEIKSLAVVPDRRGGGVGRDLLGAAEQASRSERRTRLLVSTAAASTGNLRFYQRCGFRMLTIDRDAFTPDTGYPDPIWIEGIPLRDRIWLSLDLTGA